jgi:hypothetical protein
MKAIPRDSDVLLERVRKEMLKRGVTLHRVALEAGCNYITLYHIFNPDRRSVVPRKGGKRRFSFDTGKNLERWLQK